MPDSYTRVFVHCVWSTWDRAPDLVGEVEATVYRSLRAECARMGVEVLALGGVADHVHLLVRLPPSVSLAGVMKQCKGASSHLVNHSGDEGFLFRWQGAYRAFSVAPDGVRRVQDYIARQREHHASGSLDPDSEAYD